MLGSSRIAEPKPLEYGSRAPTHGTFCFTASQANYTLQMAAVLPELHSQTHSRDKWRHTQSFFQLYQKDINP